MGAQRLLLEKSCLEVAGLRDRDKFHRSRVQVTTSVKGAVVQEHLAKARIVGCRRVKSAIALRRAFPRSLIATPGRNRFERARVFVFGISSRDARALLSGRVEGCILHAQRIEEPLLKKGIEAHAAHHLDDAGGCIDAALRIFPLVAGFVLHRRGEPQWHQIRERRRLHSSFAVSLAKTGSMREQVRDGEFRRLA